MNVIRQLLDSKKAVAMFSGVIVAVAARLGFQVESATVGFLIAPFVIYIYSQGRVDEAKLELEKQNTESN